MKDSLCAVSLPCFTLQITFLKNLLIPLLINAIVHSVFTLHKITFPTFPSRVRGLVVRAKWKYWMGKLGGQIITFKHSSL